MDNLAIECLLCGEVRRYRPSEVHLGSPDHTDLFFFSEFDFPSRLSNFWLFYGMKR
jgi:hypothetical protein